jgi:flagellin
MPVTIKTNIPSLQAQKNLQRSSTALNASFDRLSSGLRIVTAADDAAGLAISESMSTQIRSFTIAERNAQDAVSMVQTAEGALAEVHSIMGRLRELAMQAANGSYTATDRGFLDTEYRPSRRRSVESRSRRGSTARSCSLRTCRPFSSRSA